MKIVRIVAKDGKKWEFSHSIYSWKIDEDLGVLIVWDKDFVVKFILNIELFAYLEVEER